MHVARLLARPSEPAYLSAASVQPWVENSCRVAGVQAPGGGAPAAFQGIYYENVDTIDMPLW